MKAAQLSRWGPQYDSTHVYVAQEDFDRFVASFVATFGGTASKRGLLQVTPMSSQTVFQAVQTPVGILSSLWLHDASPLSLRSRTNGVSSRQY